MADKSKPKTAARAKANVPKPAEGKSAKSAEPTPAVSKTAAPKTATVKNGTVKNATGKNATANTAGKSSKAATGKGAKAAAGKAAGASPATKKSKPAAAPAEKPEVSTAESDTETYYVWSGVLPIAIRVSPPESGIRFVEFSSFADARDHLLDHLLEVIEEHERVLHAVRRAASFAEYLEQQR